MTRREKRIAAFSREVMLADLRGGALPYHLAHGCNHAETAFYELARAKGLKLARAGWPDFLVEQADGSCIGVEVKFGGDVLNPRQRRMFAMLERAGIRVYVWRPSHADRLVPWRKDAPDGPRSPQD